jgi:hypothetical protein
MVNTHYQFEVEADTFNHLGCQNSNLKLKDNHAKTHTLKEHDWGCKTLWKNTILAKTTYYLKKKVRTSKVLNFLHN